MTQAFLSHSTNDADFALKVATDLRAAGIPIWKAPESILDGEEWVAAIERGLSTSTHLLLLQSPAAVDSEWVRFEFNAALSLEKQGRMRIIPVDYLPCKPPLFWTQFQRVDGIASDYHAALIRIITRLREEQPDHPPQPTNPATTINVTVQGNVQGTLNVAGGSIIYANQPAAPPPSTPVDQGRPAAATPVAAQDDREPEMIAIPAGPFLMGSPASDAQRFEDEPLQFELNLDYDYRLGKYPVTVGEYRAFMEAGGYQWPGYWTTAGWQWRESKDKTQPDNWGRQARRSEADDLPAVDVTWYEAHAYTRWLADVTGQPYRLPTEAEWEKGARGGLMMFGGTPNPAPGRIWPWGATPPHAELLNFDKNVGQTTPVGRYPQGASPYGLLDMCGNVWEWCASEWAKPYVFPERSNPAGTARRALRGGGFDNRPAYVRCSVRSFNVPDWAKFDYGFRLALD